MLCLALQAGHTAAEVAHSVGTMCMNRAFRFLVLALAWCGSPLTGDAMAATPVVVPPGSLYVCVTESGGVRREVPRHLRAVPNRQWCRRGGALDWMCGAVLPAWEASDW